ncbi:hypothetical protein CVT24_001688 [Panaeolus cyanescens]|uniref:F-box domain-containing protein n=1 Tax=Panaeolus cyanescens TaxID=181874 RepID=A0A409YYS8_9AGAR|nr:hypothetical protein CVT24_001688 [Panaeolus cyanescens]
MQFKEFGPGHAAHPRVTWPEDLQQVVVQLPSTLINLLGQKKTLNVQDQYIIKEFRSTISAAKEENERLQADIRQQIDSLKLQLHNDGLEHARLRKQATACDAFVSPLQRISDEILRQIIQHSAEQTASRATNVITGSTPLALSLVSKQFRAVAHSIPSIWTKILIVWNGDKTYGKYRGYVELCGKLSKHLPMSVHLIDDRTGLKNPQYGDDDDGEKGPGSEEESNEDDNKGNNTNSHRVLYTLFGGIFGEWAHLNRVHKFAITTFRQDEAAKSLRRELVGRTDLSLQSVAFYQPSSEESDAIEYLNPLLATLPNLCHLKFHLNLSIESPIPETFPDDRKSCGAWARLTTLSMDGDCVTTPLWPAFLTSDVLKPPSRPGRA